MIEFTQVNINLEREAGTYGHGRITGIKTSDANTILINPAYIISMATAYPTIEKDRPSTCITLVGEENVIFVAGTLAATLGKIEAHK